MRRRRHELCSCCCGRGAEGDAKRQAELWVASGQLPLQHRETGEEEILLNLLQRINTLRFVGRIFTTEGPERADVASVPLTECSAVHC